MVRRLIKNRVARADCNLFVSILFFDRIRVFSIYRHCRLVRVIYDNSSIFVLPNRVITRTPNCRMTAFPIPQNITLPSNIISLKMFFPPLSVSLFSLFASVRVLYTARTMGSLIDNNGERWTIIIFVKINVQLSWNRARRTHRRTLLRHRSRTSFLFVIYYVFQFSLRIL